MAAPASKTISDLSGKWVLNKTLSDSVDSALALQGIRWLTRKAIGVATVEIEVKQYTDEEGKVHVHIEQTASKLSSTTEKRTADWQPREHSDWLFGRVEGRTRFITAEQLAELVAGEAVAKKWTKTDHLARDWLAGEEEKTGPDGASLLLNHVEADAGWFATQVWGFQNVGGERRYVRNVVVAKGDEFVEFKMIYDYVSE
ncbi:hypothetical protein F5Y17DRAFT_426248 [Xylariaceae sp. FL0594]|nr:hypothetical protein F5Y17DRAFT_426248 [Xylariaceae sp. FL0594]